MDEERSYSRLLPTKVKNGKMTDQQLLLTTPLGEHNINWEDVEFIFIGKIVDSIDIDSIRKDKPSTAVMKQIPVIGRIVQERVKKNVTRQEFYLAYLFIKNFPNPFRIDSVGSNLKGILGADAGYSSELNFCSALKKIIDMAKNAYLDPSADAFNLQGRRFLHTFASTESALDKAWKEKDK